MVGGLQRPTGVQGRIDNLLCPPYLRCHRLCLALLIRGDEFLCILKARRGDEEGSVASNDQPWSGAWMPITAYLPHHALVRRSRESHLGSDISADCFTRPK